MLGLAVDNGTEGDMWQDWSGKARDKRGKDLISEGGYLRLDLSHLSDRWFVAPHSFHTLSVGKVVSAESP